MLYLYKFPFHFCIFSANSYHFAEAKDFFLAQFYKQKGGRREFVKFFESRQDAEEYLISDEYWGTSKDQFDLNYRFREFKENYEIVERSLVDVLNEIYACGKYTDARLDLHSL